MTVSGTIKVEMQFAGTAGAWTDITADVQYPVKCSYGIKGNSISNRVADTGILTFALDNSAQNSAGSLGYYSPGGANVRAGFAPGIAARLTVSSGTMSRLFYGHIPSDGIQPEPLQYSTRRTEVTVLDWMDYAAQFPIKLQAMQTDKRIDEVVGTIVGLMPIAPLNTDYGTGQETFSYVFDTVGNNTRAMAEFQKIAMSEFGYITVEHDAVYGETLTVESRYGRVGLSNIGTISDAMTEIETQYGANYANKIKVTSYPRKIDAAATTVLAKLQKIINLSSGDSTTIYQKFRDPVGGSQKVAGTDMVSPVATTDYVMNAQADGLGADLTAYLSVTATYGAEGVSWALSNTGAADGYVTLLQARGKGIYTFDESVSISDDAAEISAFGEVEVVIDQKYQDNPLSAESVSKYWKNRLVVRRNDVNSVTFVPNKNEALMCLFMCAYIGRQFNLSETVTDVDGNYFINGIEYEIIAGGIITCTLYPLQSSGENYWTLGYSELGVSTILGY